MKRSPLFSQIEHAEHGHTRGIDCLIERGVNSGLTSGRRDVRLTGEKSWLSEGKRYAYRESRTYYGAPVTPVEVIKLEPKIKGKVRVIHLDGEYAGLEQWVAKLRLVVPWSESDAFCADERRALIAADISCCTERTILKETVNCVLDAAHDVCRKGYGFTEWTGLYGGLLHITDFDEFVNGLSLDRDGLLSEPGAFIDRHGAYVAPFATAVQLAQDLCRRFPVQILSSARRDEQEYCQKIAEAPDGRMILYYEEELEFQRQVNALIRQWCPEAAWNEVDERIVLRDEILYLRNLLESAIRTMESKRLKAEAASLRKELEARTCVRDDRAEECKQ